MRQGGFTLVEVLIATTILLVVVGIVYSSYAMIAESVSEARVLTEELRLRQYLKRSMETNFATAYIDKLSNRELYRFVGVDGNGSSGPQDSIRFVSTALLLGGSGLPGDMKEVRYEIVSDQHDAMTLDLDEDTSEAARSVLECTETPLLGAGIEADDLEGSMGTVVADSGYEPPRWSVPIRSMEIKYFDGEEWLDEWDSQNMARAPWCVQVRINFARPDDQLQEDRAEGYDPEEDPDFELVVPIYSGLGMEESEQ